MTSSNTDMPEESPELKESHEGREDSPPPQNSATTQDVPEFGWSAYAERINGRFAMIGFAAVLLIEAFSREPFLHWAGLIP